MRMRWIVHMLLAMGTLVGVNLACWAQPTSANDAPPEWLRIFYTMARQVPFGCVLRPLAYPYLPEGTVKLFDILSNAPPPRMLGSGERPHDWKWMAARYDHSHKGVITREEFPGPAAWFDRLDRNGDGVLSSADFDWSDRSSIVQKTLQASQVFGRLDRDSNGRISAQEWAEFFTRASKGKDHLSLEDIQASFYPVRAATQAGYSTERQLQRLHALFRGESGQLFGDAPHVGSKAPDFQLRTQDGKQQIKLSQFQGKQPVVLIFGSFT